jgi:hypothetical protein
MMTAKPESAARFAARLAAKARRLAEASLAARTQGRRRWRLAPLLWPLFAKER